MRGVLRNFAKFTVKQLCQSLFFEKVAGLRPATLSEKRLWHSCFPGNFAKFPRTLFHRTPLGDCFIRLLQNQAATFTSWLNKKQCIHLITEAKFGDNHLGKILKLKGQDRCNINFFVTIVNDFQPVTDDAKKYTQW